MRLGIVALIHLVGVGAIVFGVAAAFVWVFSRQGWPEVVVWGAALLIGWLFGSMVSSLLLRMALTVAHKSAADNLKGYLHHGK